MAFLKFEGVGITAMAAAVPKHTVDNYQYTEHFDADTVKDIVDKVGIRERRFAPEGMCASDLCQAAAEQLMEDNQIDKSEIDLLVFVSQTPDYRMPATSILLQHRLGLSKNCMSFDLSLGCSAFVYALSTVFALVEKGTIRKALILDGETRSRVYHPKDRRVAFLFGDGGIAALIEKKDIFGPSWFSLYSDGSREELIKMKAGGYRYPSSPETLAERVVDEHGNISTDEHGYMNGADVFNFVLAEIPGAISNTLQTAEQSVESINYFVFHQANSFMNTYLAKKLKISPDKAPASIEHFGNTSSVSIPLTIVTQLQAALRTEQRLLMCGFGVGMSWATGLLDFKGCNISNLVEVD